MASCDEAADLSTHEDDFHKVFCDHSSNVIFLDWVGEIHTAQSQWLGQRQRTKTSIILLILYLNTNTDPWT